jgi:hypothetical protein
MFMLLYWADAHAWPEAKRGTAPDISNLAHQNLFQMVY